MTRILWILTAALIASTPALAEDWKFLSDRDRHAPSPELSYVNRTVQSASGKMATIQFVFFQSPDFELKVIDQGTGGSPKYAELRTAFQENFCIAGCNGGFFHPGFEPLGLMISNGKRVNQLERAKLLSGVLYCDAKGIYIVRYAAFKDHDGITALVQSGPFLVENGAGIRGLSAADPRRRTFVATDWRGHWALGVTSPLTLAELGELLADKDAIREWPINRALNLDGGSSCALYYNRGASDQPVQVINWKRVRNFVGIAPR